MIKVGDRVHCKTFEAEGSGVVDYIDQPLLYQHHMSPIQVLLDEPYSEDGHRLLRFSLLEITVDT